MARNIEDFIERDLKAFNFIRAFPVWLCATGYLGMGKFVNKYHYSTCPQENVLPSR